MPCILSHRDRLADNTSGQSRDGLYENVLAESEREAVADLLQYLENVCTVVNPLQPSKLTRRSAAKQTSSQANPFERLALWCIRRISTCREARA